MLKYDWLRYRTPFAICVQFLVTVYKMITFLVLQSFGGRLRILLTNEKKMKATVTLPSLHHRSDPDFNYIFLY